MLTRLHPSKSIEEPRRYVIRLIVVYHIVVCILDMSLISYDAILFHCPFYKMVQKAFALMFYIQQQADNKKPLEQLTRDVRGNLLRSLSAEAPEMLRLHEEKVAPYCEVNRRVGNCYTASLYASLATAIVKCVDSYNFLLY